MGLYYVNADLITEEKVSDGQWERTGENYERYIIRTAKDGERKNEKGVIEKFTRPICAHNCSTVPNVNTRVSSTRREADRMPRVTVRTSDDTRYDSDVFVVALPYDGMIKPFDHDEHALQIYKSVIMKSERFSIEHEDNKYKRVAYFVVRPHHSYLNNDGWYDEACNLEVTFAQSKRVHHDDGTPSETVWTFKTTTVSFGENGQYEIKNSEETAPYEAFNVEEIHDKSICELVEPAVITSQGYSKPDGSPKNFKSGK